MTAVLHRLMNGYRMPRDEDVPTDIYKMMRACWAKTENQRPTFAELESELEVVLRDNSGYGDAGFDDVVVPKKGTGRSKKK